MTKSLFIPIHSFVDLITNSSSEIFVSAGPATLTAVKSIVDNLLKGAGSDKAADELFTFQLDGYGAKSEVGVLVTPKDGANENLVLAAKTLSNLTDLFDIDASFNG